MQQLEMGTPYVSMWSSHELSMSAAEDSAPCLADRTYWSPGVLLCRCKA